VHDPHLYGHELLRGHARYGYWSNRTNGESPEVRPPRKLGILVAQSGGGQTAPFRCGSTSLTLPDILPH